MRTIKFRGQKTTNEIWVYGSLVYSNELDAAIYYQVGNGSVKQMEWVYVNPDTIGQFTGLYDKNGTPIFEGDVVEWFEPWDGLNHRAVVRYIDERCQFMPTAIVNGEEHQYTHELFNNCCVVGNVYDNPDMAKGGVKR